MKATIDRKTFIRNASALMALPWLNSAQAAILQGSNSKGETTHRILTCNIRVDLPADEAKGFGWQQRKDVCAQVIAAERPDIICLQEVLKGQFEDLKKAFPTFQGFGFEGPEMDAHPTGYHGIAKNPILFSTERYTLLSGGTYWLSETPLIGGSISWGSARARHAVYVRLQDNQSRQEFRIVNLHLDHMSQEAREKQIGALLHEADQYPDGFPQVLTGDFNAGMANPVYRLVKEKGWQDSYAEVHGETEPGFTVHFFQGENYEKKDKGKKIDFIFFKGQARATAASIIRNHVDGRYPSDHFFVSADIQC